jgi:phospholipase/carboxylesterase
VLNVFGMPETARGGCAVVLLHGWGAPGDDLVPLAHELAQDNTRFIVPAAPLPHAAGGRAWWPLDLEERWRALEAGRLDELAEAVPPGMAEARALVLNLLDEIRSRYQPSTVIVAGFSQGGMVAMDVGLAATPPVDGIAMLSGTLVAGSVWRKQVTRPEKPAIFISHGQADEVLPFSQSERVRDLLRAHGFNVSWAPFAGGHGIPTSVLEALGTFIARVGPLDPAPETK